MACMENVTWATKNNAEQINYIIGTAKMMSFVFIGDLPIYYRKKFGKHVFVNILPVQYFATYGTYIRSWVYIYIYNYIV